jgi:ATP-dependent RNA helicase DOB1
LITYFFFRTNQGPKPEEIPAHEQYIVDIVLNCAQGSIASKDRKNITPTPGGVQPCAPGQKGVPLVVPVLLSTLDGISRIRVFMPKDLRQDHARETIWKSVLEVHRRFPDGVALLDPIQDMGSRMTSSKFSCRYADSIFLTVGTGH